MQLVLEQRDLDNLLSAKDGKLELHLKAQWHGQNKSLQAIGEAHVMLWHTAEIAEGLLRDIQQNGTKGLDESKL